MFGSLITRPLRIATRGAQITLHGAHEAIEVAEGLLGLLAARLSDNGHHDVSAEAEGSEPTAWSGPAASSASAPADAPAPAAPATGAAAPAADSLAGGGAPAPGVATPPPPPAPAEDVTEPAPPAVSESPPDVSESPPHVSEEPELVEEVSEPGAEDGAGAELRIAEPWEGYRTMKAPDIVDRLATATREEVAAVELYELSGRKRKSVLSAAQRALKQASPPR